LKVRLVTDIRPVFSDNVAEIPKVSLLIHMLNLTVRDGDSQRHLTVAMDSSDLQALKSALDRAELKEKTLKKLLDLAHLHCLEDAK
jgi:hypothetical protein